MQKEHALIIANSVYQLLNAVNIKVHILESIPADIVITDVTPSLKKYIPRLEDTKLFDQIIYGEVFSLNKEHAAAKEPGVTECFNNTENILRWKLNNEIDEYSKIFFANYDIFTRMLANYFYGKECEFIAFEDGFSSYVIDYLHPDRALINKHTQGIRIKELVHRVLLYEPHLAVRKDNLSNEQLPKIDPNDKKLVDALNYIFDYHKMSTTYKYIFLEQSFRTEGIKGNDLELMMECKNAVPANDFIVKSHPRNTVNIPFELGISRKNIDDAPWELFLLNEDFSEKVIITVCSNAALTSRIVFGMDIKTIMLYELYTGKVLWKEDDILRKYLNKFSKQFAGKNYYIPKTIYELRHTINYLGGNYE